MESGDMRKVLGVVFNPTVLKKNNIKIKISIKNYNNISVFYTL